MNETPVTTRMSKKIDQPEFLLLLVVALMLWSVGFVDILSKADFTPGTPLYNDNWSGLLLALHSALSLPWLGALFIPRSHHYLSRLLSWMQRNNWLALLTMLFVVGLVVNLFVWPFWFKFPGFSTILLIGIILFTLIFLFVRPKPMGKRLWWRKPVLLLLTTVLGVELIAQGVAYVGLLPGIVHWDGGYVKYGRIYHNLEGLGNGRANSDGWYANEFELAEESRKIALVGDTFIQALQVDPDAHLAVSLQEQLNGNSQEQPPVEILPLGHAGLGPSVYLHPEILTQAVRTYDIEEIVVYLHLSNDLRNFSESSKPDVPYTFNEEGKAVVHPNNFGEWHDGAHYVLNPYAPLHPIRIVDSHLITPLLWRSITNRSNLTFDAANPAAISSIRGVIVQSGRQDGDHNPVRAMKLLDTTGYSDFLFDPTANEQADEQADEAYAITESFVEVAYNFAKDNNITLRIVTIPAFSTTFYETFDSKTWNSTVANYDLLLPERRLQAFAESNDVPFLAMGEYMLGNVETAEQISHLFFNDGRGHLTPEGHALFAKATHDCFYSPVTLVVDGCPSASLSQ